MPAAQRLIEEHGLDADEITGTGPGGRILKEDVLARTQNKTPDAPPSPPAKPAAKPPGSAEQSQALSQSRAPVSADREEEVIPMSRLRQTVAERLVQAKQAAALLTTFNEIDMSAVTTLRKAYGDAFQQKYNVKLGFMSFFVKACVDALK